MAEQEQERRPYAGGRSSAGGPRSGGGERRGGKFVPRPKVCQFCVDKVKKIDYKQSDMLRRFVSERGKIRPRRQTGTCARHQRHLALAIKRASSGVAAVRRQSGVLIQIKSYGGWSIGRRWSIYRLVTDCPTNRHLPCSGPHLHRPYPACRGYGL